jgi:hypothetical protein
MNSRVRTSIAVAGVALTGIIGFTAANASASAMITAPTQARCTIVRDRSKLEIARREVSLGAFANAIGAAKNLQAGHEATLSGIVSADKSGLTALGTTIAGEPCADQLITDAGKIVTDYRVYALVHPQVHLTIASDRVSAIAAKVQTKEADLQKFIDTAASKGKDVTAAKAALADLDAKSKDASGQAASAATAMLGLTPANVNDGSAAAVIAGAHANLATARADLVGIKTDLATIRALAN